MGRETQHIYQGPNKNHDLKSKGPEESVEAKNLEEVHAELVSSSGAGVHSTDVGMSAGAWRWHPMNT